MTMIRLSPTLDTEFVIQLNADDWSNNEKNDLSELN